MSLNKQRPAKAGPGGVGIIKSPEGGHRKIVCPNCHQNAVPQQDGAGKIVYVCPRGHKFGSSRM